MPREAARNVTGTTGRGTFVARTAGRGESTDSQPQPNMVDGDTRDPAIRALLAALAIRQ